MQAARMIQPTNATPHYLLTTRSLHRHPYLYPYRTVPVHAHWPLSYTIDTGGPDWASKYGWLASGDPCTYVNEIVCNDAQDVVALDLYNKNMQGQLPTEFGDLTTLTTGGYGFLGDNKLSGTLPTEIGRLSAMKNGM